MVPTSLLEPVSVKVPAPVNNRLPAVMAADCVSDVLAPRVSVDPVAVTAALMATVPP